MRTLLLASSLARPRPITAADPAGAAGGVYRAFWRWHFYAGLVVMPVLMLMALTGGVYLFRAEIEAALYRPLLTVEAAGERASPGRWVEVAEAAVAGRVSRLTLPAEPTDSVRLVVERAGAGARAVYVDPYAARALGSAPEGGPLEWVARLHSLDLAGPVANVAVEIVAGWAIVMVATGVVLWWPKGRTGGGVTVRGSPSRRVFWRDLHAVTGVFAAAVILFLAVTGMPWSAVWGKEVRSLTTAAGWGRPPAPAAGQTWAHGGVHAAHHAAMPWTLQDSAVPAATGTALPLDRIVADVDAAGLPRPYTLSIPAAPDQAWSAAYRPAKVELSRTLYLDGVSGEVLGDVGYARYGPAAKAIEWGIAVHQGDRYGLANKLLMLAGCIAIWLLGASGVVMWWKRRPIGRLAAPPPPDRPGAWRWLAAVVAPLALLYPLVGASIVAVLALDFILRRAGSGGRPKLETRS